MWAHPYRPLPWSTPRNERVVTARAELSIAPNGADAIQLFGDPPVGGILYSSWSCSVILQRTSIVLVLLGWQHTLIWFPPRMLSPFPSISPRSPTSLPATRRTWHKQKRRMTREERIWLYLLKLGPNASCQEILTPTDKNVIDHDKSLCKMLRHP